MAGLVAGAVIAAVVAVAAALILTLKPGQTPPVASASTAVAPPSAGYVGSAACGRCHAAQAAAWKGSHHDRAMQEATAQTVLCDFNDAEFQYGRITSRFFQSDGRFMVRTDGPDGKLADFEIKYTFDVWPLQQYLIEFHGSPAQPAGEEQGRVARDPGRRPRRRGTGDQSWLVLENRDRTRTRTTSSSSRRATRSGRCTLRRSPWWFIIAKPEGTK